MDAIGRLAGGIAHDFNNLLSGIIGLAELLQMETDDENVQGIAREIVSVGERSAELTAKLLTFSRKGKIQIVPVDIHKMVAEVVSILRHTLSQTLMSPLNSPLILFLLMVILHRGFPEVLVRIDISVRIEANDHAAM